MDKDTRIAALESVVEVQAERIKQLEKLLDTGFEPPMEWNLPRREAQIFSMLVARDRVRKETIYEAFWDEGGVSGPTVIESHISKMRKRLARFGVRIEGERFLGYRLVDRQKYRRAQ